MQAGQGSFRRGDEIDRLVIEVPFYYFEILFEPP
jgi:hypothetical protein